MTVSMQLRKGRQYSCEFLRYDENTPLAFQRWDENDQTQVVDVVEGLFGSQCKIVVLCNSAEGQIMRKMIWNYENSRNTMLVLSRLVIYETQ